MLKEWTLWYVNYIQLYLNKAVINKNMEWPIFWEMYW